MALIRCIFCLFSRHCNFGYTAYLLLGGGGAKRQQKGQLNDFCYFLSNKIFQVVKIFKICKSCKTILPRPFIYCQSQLLNIILSKTRPIRKDVLFGLYFNFQEKRIGFPQRHVVVNKVSFHREIYPKSCQSQ